MPSTDPKPGTVAELFRSAHGPLFSFEFFPPRSEEEEPVLWAAVEALAPLQPAFVSVTYGANGSRRDRTIRATRRIAESGGPLTVGHLTCVAQSKAELAEALAEYLEAGVTNILAIRGDMPGGGPWERHPEGLANATELVRFIKSEGDFCVGVAAFANPHETSNDPDLDARILLDKVEAGAEFAITQLFFEAERYAELVERMRGLGCEIPIVPGIMPLTVITQIERFAALSGRALPDALVSRLRACASKEEVREAGLAAAVQMSRDLLAAGAPGLQFFTQNRSKATREVLAEVLTTAR
ncbi:5,10-methylenetetrahydrofolate reductase [Tessaracoccus lapidicaptus]|uniref:Methylenetetrahydrofolate reductase n=1 Tax=Tessaracoccus lapidicaptus TaxID=1427523 RepID=A0A1C0AHZ6_9ACTN|nr:MULTISPECIES: methylenetetrahydrofolate reductase [Tessaracoccus]AQX16694.1 5,10-methylenetetrahydrofolate reductase [Tessaracoccus sp. T2.5-30]OCL31673.1 5,10-methylenetetrahydrofolate reductase [Tessaracoccus lapidicaptus]VEP41439.1 5,10-methylenetetrahydrofolate reductase [Tessaracoccus lapidicaptus]